MRKGVIALLGVLVAGGAFLFLSRIEVLTLSLGERIIFSRSIKPGDIFQMAYLHSIVLSDVVELFRIDSKYRIVLTETRFQGQGAGLPSTLAEGEQLQREGNWFRITGMQRIFPSIFWRVQSQWHNRFRFKNEPEFNLSDRIGDGLIHIQIQKKNLASWCILYFTR